jgi:cytochrome c peroxidase
VACHLQGGTTEGPLADVGTGEALRSPNLRGLHARAPYLHTGALPDIRSRVMGPVDTRHGDLAGLTDSEKETLVAYLESL